MRRQIFESRSMRFGIWKCKWRRALALQRGSGKGEKRGRRRERATTRAGDPKRGGHGAAFRVSVAASVQGAGAHQPMRPANPISTHSGDRFSLSYLILCQPYRLCNCSCWKQEDFYVVRRNWKLSARDLKRTIKLAQTPLLLSSTCLAKFHVGKTADACVVSVSRETERGTGMQRF